MDSGTNFVGYLTPHWYRERLGYTLRRAPNMKVISVIIHGNTEVVQGRSAEVRQIVRPLKQFSAQLGV